MGRKTILLLFSRNNRIKMLIYTTRHGPIQIFLVLFSQLAIIFLYVQTQFTRFSVFLSRDNTSHTLTFYGTQLVADHLLCHKRCHDYCLFLFALGSGFTRIRFSIWNETRYKTINITDSKSHLLLRLQHFASSSSLLASTINRKELSWGWLVWEYSGASYCLDF